jgi:tetratricopeptide (TPR) repeat protein
MTRSAHNAVVAPEKTKRDAVSYLILFLLAVLPYSNILHNRFVYDDHFQVEGNPYAHSFKYLPQIFKTSVWSFQGAQGVSNYYRPMMTLGYLLTYQIAGLAPFGFHLVNILLNAVVVWLVFAILRRFSGERVALIAAGLFALHPIHTEAVAWVAAITDLQLAVFYLGTFLLYLRLPETPHKFRARVLMCACFALALLSKEQAMTLPVLAVIFEHFYREDRAATSLKQKFSRYGALWVVVALYLAIRIAVMRGFASVVMRPSLSWYETCLSAVALIGNYLGKLIWPARLSPFHIFQASQRFADPKVLLGILAIAGSVLLFAVLWQRARKLSFALVWIFLPLGPVLNARWMPASVFGERYLYLASLGFCWLVAQACVWLWAGSAPAAPRIARRAVPALLGIVAVAYGVRTISRNRDWRNDQSLYQSVLETQGDASLIRANLASVAFDHADSELAERDWLDALATGPANVHALDSMALLRRAQNRYPESLDYSMRALRARPEDTFGHVNLAVTLTALGRAAEAEWRFRVAIALSPLSTNAHNTYGKFLLLQGRAEEARAEFERSVDADFNTDAYDILGDIYLGGQNLPQAEMAYRRALSGNASDSHAHVGLGKVLELAGRPADALREYETGLAIDPSDAAARAGVERLRSGSPAQSAPQ